MTPEKIVWATLIWAQNKNIQNIRSSLFPSLRHDLRVVVDNLLFTGELGWPSHGNLNT